MKKHNTNPQGTQEFKSFFLDIEEIPFIKQRISSSTSKMQEVIEMKDKEIKRKDEEIIMRVKDIIKKDEEIQKKDEDIHYKNEVIEDLDKQLKSLKLILKRSNKTIMI